MLGSVAIFNVRAQTLEIFDKRIGNIGAVIVGDASGGALHILHKAIEVVAGIGDADDADGGAVPEFGGIEFSDGNVETGAQPVFQAADDLATIFDRLRRFDVEFEGEKSDHVIR